MRRLEDGSITLIFYTFCISGSSRGKCLGKKEPANGASTACQALSCLYTQAAQSFSASCAQILSVMVQPWVEQ